MLNTNQKAARKEHQTFRACGPIRAMLANEYRSIPDWTKVIQDAIAAGLGKKYPKLLQRYQILREEGRA